MTVIVLKLVTGEEVLGENVSETSEVYKLKNPVGIAVVRGQDGQPNIGFAPFPLHAEQKSNYVVDINSTFVVYSYEPAEDFITNYNQIFGSGIVVPSKKLIMG